MNIQKKNLKSMKKIYLLLLFLGIFAITKAQIQTYMLVHTSSISTYNTNDVPVMTFNSTDLIVNYLGTNVPYIMDDVSKITFDHYVGVDEENSYSNVGLYPNPNNGIFYLNVEDKETKKFIVEIYNITGSLISTNTYESNIGKINKKIDLSSYVNGVYLVKINNITKKIVKN